MPQDQNTTPPPDTTDGLAVDEALPEPGVPNNDEAVNALFAALLPPEEVDPNAMPVEEIARVSALAQNPKLGDKFTLAGREFTRQFLTIDAEQDLIELVRDVLLTAPQGNMLLGFMGKIRETQRAVAIILQDQDPAADLAWLKKTKGVTTSQLVGVIVAQMKVNQITDFLQELLAMAALAGQFIGAKAPV